MQQIAKEGKPNLSIKSLPNRARWGVILILLFTGGLILGAALAWTKGLAQAAPDPFTGNPPITPRWAFEPWVWEDNSNTYTSTQNLVNGYISRSIPVGAVIIDNPWETAYNTLAWDLDRYPNPQQMIADLHGKGVRVILWITGFINQESPDYDYVKSHGYAINQGQDFVWWKGKGVYLDFTNSAALHWWHAKLDSVLNLGVDGWKVDMSCEYISSTVETSLGSLSRQEFKKYFYADFFDHSLLNNSQAIILARSYSSRQGGVGAPVSRLSAGWSGDFQGDFSGLNDQIKDVYESARLGYGAPGVEVGGYLTPAPSRDSLIRTAQFAALTPIMENGGANGGEAEHLPWHWDSASNSATAQIYRYFATLHSELAPYLFSYGVEANLTGKSILRETDPIKKQHKLGEELFVSALASNATARQVDFPADERWIDYWDDRQVYDGGTHLNYPAALDRYPLFIKAGAILPLDVKTSLTGHGSESSAGKTTLLIYPYWLSSFTFHQPLGAGTEYSDVQISVSEATGTILVSGAHPDQYLLRIKSFSRPSVVLGADEWSYDENHQMIIIEKQGQDFSVNITGLQGYGYSSSTSTSGGTPRIYPDYQARSRIYVPIFPKEYTIPRKTYLPFLIQDGIPLSENR